MIISHLPRLIDFSVFNEIDLEIVPGVVKAHNFQVAELMPNIMLIDDLMLFDLGTGVQIFE